MGIRLLAEILFWGSVAAFFYTYLGYPLLLALVSRLWPHPQSVQPTNAAVTPTVTIIIAAYNEERDLPAKLENTLSLDYPRDRLELIVASDCSADRTDDIVRAFAARVGGALKVRLHRQVERLGKTAAQNAAVELAQGDILLFSDATTLYQPDVLRVMMRDFVDPTVGCVAGRLLYVDPTQSNVGQGARSYWGYETFLKACESRIGSLIGVSGCLYAVRRTAYVPLPNEACSDFIIATVMVEQKLRAIYEPAAICTEETNQRTKKELQMRVRIITQTFSDLWRHRAMLNPLRSGFYAIQLLSHKVFRYLVPVFMIAMLIAAVPLALHSAFYAVILGAQLSFYGLATAGWLVEKSGTRSRLLALPQYFVLANLASLIAFYKFLSGERYARWDTARAPVANAPSVMNTPVSSAPGIAPTGETPDGI